MAQQFIIDYQSQYPIDRSFLDALLDDDLAWV